MNEDPGEKLKSAIISLRKHYIELISSTKIGDEAEDETGVDIALHQEKIIVSVQYLIHLINQIRLKIALKNDDT